MLLLKLLIILPNVYCKNIYINPKFKIYCSLSSHEQFSSCQVWMAILKLFTVRIFLASFGTILHFLKPKYAIFSLP